MAKKYVVEFSGGQASDGVSGCNYMLTMIEDQDGNMVRLYAEQLVPDDWDDADDVPQEEINEFDETSHEALKEEILQQAEEYGLTEDNFEFL